MATGRRQVGPVHAFLERLEARAAELAAKGNSLAVVGDDLATGFARGEARAYRNVVSELSALLGPVAEEA